MSDHAIPTLLRKRTEIARDIDQRQAEQAAQDDLAAQESMARSTIELVNLTRNQNVLSVIESGLLIAALALTSWAAYSARVAAAAAQASVAIAQHTAEAQLRSYVHIARMVLLKPDKEAGRVQYLIKTEIKNFGQTPAHDLVFSAQYALAEYPLSEGPLNEPQGKPDSIGTSLAPGADTGFYQDILPIYTSKIGVIEDRNGGAGIYVWGKITYRDAFSPEPRVTQFKMVYTGPISADTKLFSTYLGENYAT